MNTSAPHPFSLLEPTLVLDALESLNLFSDGRLLALNSYENRVYQVGMEQSSPLVVKFYRPGRWTDAAILEEHAFVSELAAQEIPVVAPMEIGGHSLHRFQDFRYTVFPRQGGRSPELEQAGTLEWIGRFMGRIHAVGIRAAYQERPTLDLASFGESARDILLARGAIPSDLKAAWLSVVNQALEGVKHAYERASEVRTLRLHGDCHVGNLLWTDKGPHFVDFDDSRMGPAIQDLWMLLSGDRNDMSRQLTDVLAGYEDFCEFNPRELHLIEALRTLRLIHYSAWLSSRWDDPAFPAAFPWFGSQRYWQDRILELREQVALMAEPPLWPA